jgi:type I restriction enzyme M protein
LTSLIKAEAQIRRRLIEADVVDCIVALPEKLFYTTGIPVCLWFLDRNKASSGERDRRGEVVFIYARGLGQKVSSTQVQLTDLEIDQVADTYNDWRGTTDSTYQDRAGFCKSATLEEIEAFEFSLAPGRYVGAPEEEQDEVEFEERMATLVDELAVELAENAKLAAAAKVALERAGYGVD